MTPRLTLALLIAGFTVSAQHNYIPLGSSENDFLPDTGVHAAIWPARLDQNGMKDIVAKRNAQFVRGGWWGKTWLGRKLSHEHLVDMGNNGWSVWIDPVLDVHTGKQFGESGRTVSTNKRGGRLQGRIGQKFTFESTLIESQVFVPQYMDDYVSRYQIVPGEGIARRFYTDGWDHRWASGSVSYTPNKYFHFGLGQGSFFIGEGYRSMLLSDNALNYPYFRIETTFGPFKYVNLWAQLYDIRPGVNLNPGNRKKWLSTHYLSWNVTGRFNIGLFEAVVLGSDSTNGGMDVSFFNPVIFYRPIEDQIDSRRGNALIGLTSSYHFPFGVDLYGQLLLDEFNLSALRNGEGSWLNKFAYQIGVKYHCHFGHQLTLKSILEANVARPFTYTHRDVLTNYGHYNQPLAHPLGTNFMELVFRNTLYFQRWIFESHLSFARQGRPLSSGGVVYANGSDIWTSYNNRNGDLGFDPGGNPAVDVFNLRLSAAYVLQSAWNLEIFAAYGLRSGDEIMTPVEVGSSPLTNSQSWFSIGLRTRLFRNYNDI